MISVSDPDSLIPDTDQAFEAEHLLIQVHIQNLDDQKLETIYSWKKCSIFYDQKLQFTYP